MKAIIRKSIMFDIRSPYANDDVAPVAGLVALYASVLRLPSQ